MRVKEHSFQGGVILAVDPIFSKNMEVTDVSNKVAAKSLTALGVDVSLVGASSTQGHVEEIIGDDHYLGIEWKSGSEAIFEKEEGEVDSLGQDVVMASTSKIGKKVLKTSCCSGKKGGNTSVTLHGTNVKNV